MSRRAVILNRAINIACIAFVVGVPATLLVLYLLNVRGVLLFAGGMLVFGVLEVLFGKETESAAAGARRRLGQCVSCGYDITGNINATRCPECGKKIDARARRWQRATTGK